MADRYYVETPLASGKATLAGAEAHHLTHVMRAKPGTEVVLFDGLGIEAAAQVETLGRSRVELRIHAHSASMNRALESSAARFRQLFRE